MTKKLKMAVQKCLTEKYLISNGLVVFGNHFKAAQGEVKNVEVNRLKCFFRNGQNLSTQVTKPTAPIITQ